ncbi:MAG: hypothetical protein MK202_06370 [Tenacibaculum sp.]|nr:hypothetical protein [Tenacibaculum sp.]
MKKLYHLTFILSISFFSCTNEKNLSDDTSNTRTLLKTITYYGEEDINNEKIITIYENNKPKKLLTYTTNDELWEEIEYFYNDKGLIEKVKGLYNNPNSNTEFDQFIFEYDDENRLKRQYNDDLNFEFTYTSNSVTRVITPSVVPLELTYYFENDKLTKYNYNGINDVPINYVSDDFITHGGIEFSYENDIKNDDFFGINTITNIYGNITNHVIDKYSNLPELEMYLQKYLVKEHNLNQSYYYTYENTFDEKGYITEQKIYYHTQSNSKQLDVTTKFYSE